MENQNTSGFYGLGIAPRLLEAIERLKFTEPTPIQRQSIPVAVEGKDVIGIAQTGTGKTLAFGIPMLQRLAQEHGQGLVLLPTRELAIQVDESLHAIGRGFGLRTAILIGGAAMGPQLGAIRNKPHVIVATPGRLIDHLQQGTIKLSTVRVLVLDEADRMLDMGFAPQIKQILAAVPRQRQTMLFSATMPAEIVGIARNHMQLPVRVEVAPPGTTADRITHELFVVGKADKLRLLETVLQQYRGTVLVFSRTKHGASKIARAVKAMGNQAAEIHANRSLSQRREALEGFKSGKYRVLVATDIAARGIDVSGIELVANFDLPSTAEDYVHRIGRTGRAGRGGHAISFATPDQARDVRAIEQLIKQALPVSQLPQLPPHRAVPNAPTRAAIIQRSRQQGGSARREGGRPQAHFGRPHRDQSTHSQGERGGQRGRSSGSRRGGPSGPGLRRPRGPMRFVEGHF